MICRLGLHTFTTVALVQSLVWELRSHIKLLHTLAEKKKKKMHIQELPSWLSG